MVFFYEVVEEIKIGAEGMNLFFAVEASRSEGRIDEGTADSSDSSVRF